MDVRSLLKKCMMDFLLIQAGITLAMGVSGCMMPSAYDGITHYFFFLPFVYAFFCMVPSVVIYSAKELSIKEMLVRKVLHFILIELIVMLVSYGIGALENAFLRKAIPLSVVVVYAAINVLEYLFYKSEADTMTRRLQDIRKKGREDESGE